MGMARRGQAGFSTHLDTNKINSESKRATKQRRHRVLAVVSLNNEVFSTSVLVDTPGRRKKFGEQVNKKRFYRESGLLDVGLVVQKQGSKVQYCYSGV